MNVGFGKKKKKNHTHTKNPHNTPPPPAQNVFTIPNSVCLSVTAVQTLRFNTVDFLRLKSEEVMQSQGYVLEPGLPEP